MRTDHNPYTPPATEVRDTLPDDARAAPFYVVASAKFIVLYIATLGFYQLFWFYTHWSRWRTGRGETIWPVPRALFALFYTHALARRIERTLGERKVARRWWPMTLATVFVVMELLNYGSAIAWPWLVFHLSNAWLWLEWLGVIVIPVNCVCLLRIQLAANAACGDPDGRSNRRFTIYNLAWILVGVSATAWTIWYGLRTGTL
ncbi:hypothetical protein [Luteimonas terrae]|uniref:MFS transporter permease n=1 Tax=Luteimonas terrae TaxID=1530191 RepID=A0ABU1Y0E1_9GAMM|nr:hypothetical protein [Luteimonas terrae]MDR7194502.1 hypothetical protein [Luteimonas terrae]